MNWVGVSNSVELAKDIIVNAIFSSIPLSDGSELYKSTGTPTLQQLGVTHLTLPAPSGVDTYGL
jgi:hypothetical protein